MTGRTLILVEGTARLQRSRNCHKPRGTGSASLTLFSVTVQVLRGLACQSYSGRACAFSHVGPSVLFVFYNPLSQTEYDVCWFIIWFLLQISWTAGCDFRQCRSSRLASMFFCNPNVRLDGRVFVEELLMADRWIVNSHVLSQTAELWAPLNLVGEETSAVRFFEIQQCWSFRSQFNVVLAVICQMRQETSCLTRFSYTPEDTKNMFQHFIQPHHERFFKKKINAEKYSSNCSVSCIVENGIQLLVSNSLKEYEDTQLTAQAFIWY